MGFEVKMVKITAPTAPPSPAPAPTGALTHFHPTLNKTSPKGASHFQGHLLITFSIFLAHFRGTFLPSEIVF